ncbi:MAG: sulfotransferase [Desulfobulbaceae bacterium]|nr:sulfotransferase [Desulfobulbaceae bacterium]
MTKISRKLKRKKKAAVPDPLLQEAIAFYKARNWQAADRTCRELLRKNPSHHKGLNLLSIVLTNKPDLVEAEKHIRRAIEIKPNQAAYHSNLGLILKEQEKWEESFQAFAAASRINPRDDETLYNLGTVHQALHNTEQALECYRRAISVNPSHVQACCALSSLLSRSPEHRQELEAVLQHMEELLTQPALQAREQLCFELARVHDKLGNTNRVFEFLDPANKIVRERFLYDVTGERELFASIEQAFTPDLLQEKEGNGLDDFSPIFIIGMPRSGTTLVEQILASHSRVAAGGELYFLNAAISKAPELAVPFRPDTIKLPNYSQIRLVPGATITEIAGMYRDSILSLQKNGRQVTDKMPHNFIHAGMIRLLFPHSRVIHCRRDPMDNGLSLYMQNFKSLHPYIYSLKEIGEYYSAYHSLMSHWQQLLPGFIHSVSYESLIHNPEQETKKLLKYCGLEWEESCLAFYKLKRYIKTASEGQADQPLYTSSIGRWKKYEEHLHQLRNVLQENGVIAPQ